MSVTFNTKPEMTTACDLTWQEPLLDQKLILHVLVVRTVFQLTDSKQFMLQYYIGNYTNFPTCTVLFLSPCNKQASYIDHVSRA